MSESETKGVLKSLSFWGIVVTALSAIGGWVTANSDVLGGVCVSTIPSPWDAACTPLVSLIVIVIGLLMGLGGVTRRKDIKGLWK